MRVHLVDAKVNIWARVMEVHAYPQVVARASWHPSCLTSLAAVTIVDISRTFDLPLAATCTLLSISQLSPAPDQAVPVDIENVPLRCSSSSPLYPLVEP